MTATLETRLKQKDINSTPKVILEILFTQTDELRCKYEEEEFKLRNRLNDYKKSLEDYKKDEIWGNDPEQIDWYNRQIKNLEKQIRTLNINMDILWKNELKMDKVLEYGLE